MMQLHTQLTAGLESCATITVGSSTRICFWGVLFVGLLIALSGCSSFSSADRNPAFADPAAVNGEITASEEASLKQVMQAAQISMKELGIEDVAVESDDQSAKLAGRAPTGQRVFVTVRKHGQRTTKLSIVVVPGDEVGPGRLLLGKIENRLLTPW